VADADISAEKKTGKKRNSMIWDIIFIVVGLAFIIKPTISFNPFFGGHKHTSSKAYKIYRRIFGAVLIVAGVYFLITKQ
jgi:hypothetical protein